VRRPDDLHGDPSQFVRINTNDMNWHQSPAAGVWRKRLERTGPLEAGRVTSVVRYDPGSSFPAHPHPDGEEILVLEGVFSDQRGDHGAGTWLLNPEGFTHAPRSGPGCRLFVKLRQAPGRDRLPLHIDTRQAPSVPTPAADGVQQLLLLERPEVVRMVRFSAGGRLPPTAHARGAEIFVLSGAISDAFGHHPAGTWLRYPPGTAHQPRSPDGALVYLKTEHLAG